MDKEAIDKECDKIWDVIKSIKQAEGQPPGFGIITVSDMLEIHESLTKIKHG